MVLPQMTLSFAQQSYPQKQLKPYLTGQSLGTLVSSDTDVDIIAIDARGIAQLLVQINNSDAANGLVYTLYGTDAETIPPDFPTGPWEAIAGATGTLTFGTNKTVLITQGYSYVLVRAHRQTTLQNSHIDVYAREE